MEENNIEKIYEQLRSMTLEIAKLGRNNQSIEENKILETAFLKVCDACDELAKLIN